MTVRAWFRILRGEVWRHGTGPDVELYLRNETPTWFEPGPLRKPIRVQDIHDVQKFVNEGAPVSIDPPEWFRRVTRDDVLWGYKPSKDITS